MLNSDGVRLELETVGLQNNQNCDSFSGAIQWWYYENQVYLYSNISLRASSP